MALVDTGSKVKLPPYCIDKLIRASREPTAHSPQPTAEALTSLLAAAPSMHEGFDGQTFRDSRYRQTREIWALLYAVPLFMHFKGGLKDCLLLAACGLTMMNERTGWKTLFVGKRDPHS